MNTQSVYSFHFWILVSIVAISGFSQGMLLPLIAIIFEKSGVSSSLNGLHATALYIGVLIASPLMEAPLRKFGYKPLILLGGLTVGVSLFFFPVWQTFWFWFILRLVIGIGDHMLHFATQTWITSSSVPEKRGRNISLYGLFFGLGFAVGPLMAKLVDVHVFLPFFVSGALTLIAWLFVLMLPNDFPEKEEKSETDSRFLQRFLTVLKYAWVALLPPFGYGFLEASLNGNFPVFALREGLSVSAVSILLPAFAIGSIIFQLPLGILSDHYGRKKILQIVMLIGALCFVTAGLSGSSPVILFICFLISGMAVGSTFSLGISYMADLLPNSLLPAGNIMCGIFFSLGSMTGPFLGGLAIEHINGPSFFYVMGGLLLAIFLSLSIFSPVSRSMRTENL